MGPRTTNDRATLDQLRLLATELEGSYPGAAAALREGIEATLTPQALGIRGKLKSTLESASAGGR